MNFKSIEKWIQGKNVLLLFLMALIVIVIIDCNTKMFSNMLKTVEGQNGAVNNGPNNSNNCGSCYPSKNNPQQLNPRGCAQQNCNAQQVNNANTNANNNTGGSPTGYVEDEVLFTSATQPLGPNIPKTMQQDYSVLKGFGLVKMPDVINYIPGAGPQQFKGVVDSNVNRNANVNRNTNVNRNANNNSSNKKVDIRMYYAPWCGHSKNSRPEMDKLINKHNNTNIDGVNVGCNIVDSEESKEETKKQGINGFPTFKAHLFKDGKEVSSYILELPERTFEALESALKEAVDKIKSM